MKSSPTPMWIIIRLLAFVVAFVVRLRPNLIRPKRFGELDGKTFYYSIKQDRSGVRGYRVGIPFKVPVVFRLQAEDASDSFFKSIGYAKEYQTGDLHFDSSIYIASDHPALFEHLAERDEARRLISDAIQSGYNRVAADGSYLWIEHEGDASPSDTDMVRVDELHNAFKDIGRRIRLRNDRYNLRVMLVEALTWSIAIYSIATIFEWSASGGSVHVQESALLKAGLFLAVLMFIVLFMVIRAILDGSSRGHRILVEGVLLLLIGLPVSGISLVSELNRRLDVPTPTMMSRQITKRYFKTTRRKNRTRYHYYVEFADTPTFGGHTLPDRVKLPRSEWERLPQRGPIWQKLGSGAFGLAWYRGFASSP